MKKSTLFIRSMALMAGLLLAVSGWGQYSGTGTFTKITSIVDLTDGYYVIAEANDQYAMNNTHNGTFLDRTAISPSSGSLTNPSASIVWLIETNGGGRSVYNEGIAKYVSYTGSSNNVQIVDAVTANNQRWTISYGSNVFTFTNLAVTTRLLQYNNSSPRFACYIGTQRNLNLYKLDEVSGDPTINLAPGTLSGFAYLEGNGPSTSQSFEVSGSNLDGTNVTVTAPSNFEISEVENGTYSGSISLVAFDGTATDIWVRLAADLAADEYSGDISISGGGADAINVAVSGTVVEAFGIPYSNNFRTLSDNARALLQGFDIEDANQETGAGGYLKVFLNGFVETPEIDFTAFDQLKLAFSTATFGTGSNRQLELKISNDGGVNYQSLFTAFPTSSDYDDNVVIVDLTGTNNVTNGKFKFEMTSGTGQIRFRDLSMTELPDILLIGAADDASNYGDTWAGNGGYGFEPWNLYISGGSSADAGHFLGNSTAEGHGNINSADARSFGMYGNNNRFANAERSITSWGDGATFSIQLAVQWRDGARGITLFNANGFAPADEIWNFNISNDGYGTTGWGYYGDMVLTFEITQTGGDLSIKVIGSSENSAWTDNQTFPVSDATLGGFRLYTGGHNAGTDGQRNLYANNLKIETDPTTIPQYVDLYVKGQVELNTNLEVENLIIEANQFLQINPGVNLTVNGALINENTASKSQSGLLIKSNATGTGSLIHNTADVPATVERYFAGTEQWRLVSSPVVNQAVSGEWTPAGTYQPDNTGYDFYAYDEPTYTWLNQKVGANYITQFVPGKGYLVSFEATDQTKLFTDNLNNGDVVVAVTKTSTGAYAGANLIGNPYASGIDWNLATRSLFADDYAYIYDPTEGGGAGNYVTVNGNLPDAFIAPHQGFFVLANEAGNFTFSNSMRVHGGTFAKNSGVQNQLVMQFSNNTYYDHTTLRIIDNAEFTRDRSDAIKMYSFNPAAPQLYTFTSDQKKVAINSIPSIPEEGSVALGLLVPETGVYTLSLAGISGEFDTDYVYLEDLVSGITQNLAENPVYSFHAEKGEVNNRFLLKFGALSVPELPGSIQLHAYTSGNTLYVLNQAEKAHVEVYNVQGQLVLSHAIGQGLQSMQTALAPGAYIVRLTSDKETATRKLVIQ